MRENSLNSFGHEWRAALPLSLLRSEIQSQAHAHKQG
jgi:hypothetical protein